MSKFTITFECDNSSFADCKEDEISAILAEIARKVQQEIPLMDDKWPIRDANGNTIGQWEYTA